MIVGRKFQEAGYIFPLQIHRGMGSWSLPLIESCQMQILVIDNTVLPAREQNSDPFVS
jgi:hypothetical protein